MTKMKKDQRVIKIRRALNKHGLLCDNETCKVKLDCTIDYELFQLFEEMYQKQMKPKVKGTQIRMSRI